MNKKLIISLLPLLLVVSSCSTGDIEKQEIHIHHYVVEEGVEATCLEDGISNKVYCDECGYVLHDHEIIEAFGHNIIDINELEPTCTENGHTSGYMCSRCGEVFEGKNTMPALGHVEILFKEKVEPTHDHVGHTEIYKCERCGKIVNAGKDIPKKHVKGTFVDFCIEQDEFIENPGVFKCSLCDEEYHDTIMYEDIHFPILNLKGDISSATKENKVNIECDYNDGTTAFDCDATIKIQGATSAAYPKKNYNIQLYKKGTDFVKKEKVKLVNSWGKQSKYTLKANYIDFSQARNVVSAKIYGQIASTRTDDYASLINGGAVDGYPILIFENGVYQGLYTLNTPKEHWRFDMEGDENTREAILMSEHWTDAGRLLEHLDYNFTGYTLEHSSTEDFPEIGNEWVVDSFNNFIDFINDSSDEVFINHANEYVNVDAAIDNFIYSYVIFALDNRSKNILWSTYDGTIWTPNLYDLDATWGLRWDGQQLYSPTAMMDINDTNVLWMRLVDCFWTRIVERYNELRITALSLSNIETAFDSFFALIPESLVAADYSRWYGPNSNILTNTAYRSQIIEYATQRLGFLDLFFC